MLEALSKIPPDVEINKNTGRYKERREKLKKLFPQQGVEGVLVSNQTNIEYLTGFKGLMPESREAYLFITPEKTNLFTAKMYFNPARKLLKEKQIHDISDLLDQLGSISKIENIKNIGIDESNLTVKEYKTIKKILGERQLKDFHLESIRMIKDEHEIQQIHEVSCATDIAFGYVLPHIKEGITELELRKKLEKSISKTGYDIGFKAIVAFGPNASDPHHLTDETRLAKNNFVLFDFGLKGKEGYISDMTRTVFFGQPTKEQLMQYQTVQKAQQAVIQSLNKFYSNPENKGKTMSTKETDAIARDFIINAGYPDMPHNLGHGIGLNMHEQPFLHQNTDDPLREGMVFSVEPGIYLPDGGVRIEDLVTITNRGVEVLNRAPKRLIIIPSNSSIK